MHNGFEQIEFCAAACTNRALKLLKAFMPPPIDIKQFFVQPKKSNKTGRKTFFYVEPFLRTNIKYWKKMFLILFLIYKLLFPFFSLLTKSNSNCKIKPIVSQYKPLSRPKLFSINPCNASWINRVLGEWTKHKNIIFIISNLIAIR